jgi:hypothetical protein
MPWALASNTTLLAISAAIGGFGAALTASHMIIDYVLWPIFGCTSTVDLPSLPPPPPDLEPPPGGA